jgi:hypothetical protein
VRYTLEHARYLCHKWFCKNSKEIWLKFQDGAVPHRNINKLRQIGSLVDVEIELERKVLNEEKLDEIGGGLEHSLLEIPHTLCTINWGLRIVVTNCHKILTLKPCKKTVVHEFQPRDPTKRMNFL